MCGGTTGVRLATRMAKRYGEDGEGTFVEYARWRDMASEVVAASMMMMMMMMP